jgi:hypothetical protein
MHLPRLSPLKTLKIGLKYIKTASHPDSTTHSTISTQLFRGKIHFDWFHEVEILHGRWQDGETVGYLHPSGLH